MKKTILVTGGAGFIGLNFIRLLLQEKAEYRIVCVDCLTYAGNENAVSDAKKHADFVFYKENICNRDGIFQIFEKERPQIVVNFAAESHVDRSIKNPKIFLETNVLGVEVLLDACRKYGVKRFHQVSTDEVYGELPLMRRDLLFNEDSPIRPSSPYSASKASADLLVLAYHRTYGLSVTISRCSNNYGPYQHAEKLIPMTIKNAFYEKKIPIYGDGLNVRDWVHVEDHCRGILAILEKGKDGEIYNLGGNNERNNLEVVKFILAKMGKSENLITFVPDRLGHDLRYAIDSHKANSELGWNPITDFENGIEKTIKWYLSDFII